MKSMLDWLLEVFCESTDQSVDTSLHRQVQSESTLFSSIGCATHDYHGDDSLGYTGNCIVVADGVSGTSGASGILARALVVNVVQRMTRLRKKAQKHQLIKPKHFQKAVEKACKQALKAVKTTSDRLDSTLTVCYLDEFSQQAYVYVVGDCKCVFVRDRKIVYESESLVYDFNVPAVVSTKRVLNCANSANIEVFSYRKGDVCLVFSDGMADNLFTDEVMECIYDENVSLPIEGNDGLGMDMARRMMGKTLETFDPMCPKKEFVPFAVSALQSFIVKDKEMDQSRMTSELNDLETKMKCREMFGKEKFGKRRLDYYTCDTLLRFATNGGGKMDDVSICSAILK